MFQQLLGLIPHEPGTVTLVAAVVGTLAGAGMWLAGSRVSRPVLTLTAVALGTAIGKKLPLWCGWSIDGMGPAIGGAVILGVSAFALHRLWVSLWLGAVLACWTALGVWVLANHDPSWAWPLRDAGETLPQYLSDVWHHLPGDVAKVLPFFCGIAMLSGVAAGVLWPRLGLAVMWSAGGVTMLIAGFAIAIQKISPRALQHLPRQTWVQLCITGGLVVIGAIWQWKIAMPAEIEIKRSDLKPADVMKG